MAPYINVAGHVVGKKHFQALRYWLPSIFSYAAIAFIGSVWIYDYDPIMKKIPFVRNRFRYPYEEDKRVYIAPVYDL